MKQVQLAVDVIDTRIDNLKKEVANLKMRREHLLFGATGFNHFEDQILILGLLLYTYSLCSFISFPCVYFSPPPPNSTLYSSSTYDLF